MTRPLGPILKLRFAPANTWLSLGPGWAALAGALSASALELSFATIMQLLVLWLLVDPLLGSLWDLAVDQRVWKALSQAALPAPARSGFYLPYAQPGSAAGHWIVWLRRYRRWWQEHYWPERSGQCLTFILGAGLALLISFSLSLTLFQLTWLSLALTLLTGQISSDLSAADGGRLQSVVQMLLPWIMGIVLWSDLTALGLLLGMCYWVSYLGGLRMLGQHQRAEWLFWLGQIAVIMLLLALRQLPGAALLGVLLTAQLFIHTKFHSPPDFLPKAQPYLIGSILIAGWSLGRLLNV